MNKVNVIIIGKPGAGKSSVSQRLSESQGLANVDFGMYLRSVAADSSSLLGRYVATFWSRNNLKEIGFEYFDKGKSKHLPSCPISDRPLTCIACRVPEVCGGPAELHSKLSQGPE